MIAGFNHRDPSRRSLDPAQFSGVSPPAEAFVHVSKYIDVGFCRIVWGISLRSILRSFVVASCGLVGSGPGDYYDC